MEVLKKLFITAMLPALIMLIFSGCRLIPQDIPKQEAKPKVKSEPTTMTLATTTSTQDSGLLDVLIPAFEKKYKIKVKVLAVGSGEAIELGKRGDVDVLLVHSRKAEDEFVAQGYGVNRKDVMHNDFVIVGPENDPAKIKGGKDVLAAFKKIADSKSTFISRGDDSGTHKKELSIWEKTGIKPGGKWYIESGQGMGETLRMAWEKGGYTLADRATYLAQKNSLKLPILVEGDRVLYNPYGVIAVNKEKFSNVRYKEANDFVEFITSAEGQKIIGEFGVDRFGQQLFVPDALNRAKNNS